MPTLRRRRFPRHSRFESGIRENSDWEYCSTTMLPCKVSLLFAIQENRLASRFSAFDAKIARLTLCMIYACSFHALRSVCPGQGWLW
jgi:hypothetical protein